MNIDNTLEERGSTHGDFYRASVYWDIVVDAMHNTPNWASLAPAQRRALTTIIDKTARILHGDYDFIDNWHDIIGYARLVERELEKSTTTIDMRNV